MRDPRNRDPVCMGHYQQALRHPDRPLRELRRKRPRSTAFVCPSCDRQKNHYAKDLCKACYEWIREHGKGRLRRLRSRAD